MKLRKFLLPFFLLFIYFQLQSQQIYLYHDSVGSTDYQSLTRGKVNWKKISNNTLNLGFVKKNVIWLKIINSNKSQLLTIPNASIDSITFYSANGIILCGDRVYNPNYEYHIPMFPCGDSIMILRIKKEYSSLVIPLEFKNKNAFLPVHSRYVMLDVLLLGVFISFLLLAISLYIYSRSTVFLFFSCYVITTILFYYTSNGLLKSIFFPRFLYFSEIRLYVSCFAPITLFWFNRSLIQYRTAFFDSFTKYLVFSILILVFTSFFLFDIIKDSFVQSYVFLIYLLCFMLIVALFYMNNRELFMPKKMAKRRFAYLFLGSIIITLFLFVLESIKFDWLPDFDYLLLITCLEVIVFGIFISIDFIEKFKEKEQLAFQLFESKKRALNELKIIQFKERKKISTILHNRYQSQLTGFRLYLGNILSSDQQIFKEMKSFEEEIRDFSHQILPKELENGLFNDAIYRQLQFLRTIYPNWKITYQTFDLPSEISSDWIYDMYLILSELLQNSFKHSNGNMITIEFYNHDNEYLLTYSDNGNSLEEKAFEEGFGISLIRDQIENIGSEINFELNPNLLIIIRIPK